MLLFRPGLVLMLFVLVFLFFYLDRSGLFDNQGRGGLTSGRRLLHYGDGHHGGYGDIVPVSDRFSYQAL